jgi:hypothetical protein
VITPFDTVKPGDLQFGDWVAVRCGDRVIAGIVTGIGGRSSPHKYSGGYDWWAGCIPTIFGINYEEQCNDWGPSPTPVARDISDIVEVRRAPVAPVEPSARARQRGLGRGNITDQHTHTSL